MSLRPKNWESRNRERSRRVCQRVSLAGARVFPRVQVSAIFVGSHVHAQGSMAGESRGNGVSRLFIGIDGCHHVSTCLEISVGEAMAEKRTRGTCAARARTPARIVGLAVQRPRRRSAARVPAVAFHTGDIPRRDRNRDQEAERRQDPYLDPSAQNQLDARGRQSIGFSAILGRVCEDWKARRPGKPLRTVVGLLARRPSSKTCRRLLAPSSKTS